MQLLDGTWIKGFDEVRGHSSFDMAMNPSTALQIILATGYLTSFPFLADYHNEYGDSFQLNLADY